MIRSIQLDDATVRALERHETLAHATGPRRMRDLGDAFALFDPADADPFWNRIASLRWPDDPAAFDRRLTEALALFAAMGRQPHVWPSPVHGRPADLVRRLAENGFQDIGGGHLMVLADPGRCPPPGPGELPPGVTVQTMGGPRGRRLPGPVPGPAAVGDEAADGPDALALVLAQAFGALPGRAAELAVDLRAALADPRIAMVLVRLDGEPAAAAKATTFDGLTYLSSIGTRPAFRGRGLAGIATRAVLAASGGGTGPLRTYLGVFSGNEPALRLYDGLGFASIGEAPDLLLE